MGDFFRRYSLQLTGVILLVTSFQLMSVSTQHPSFPRLGVRLIDSILTPIAKLQHDLFSSIDALWNHYVWLLMVEEERNELLERVKQLEETNSRFAEYQSENARLRDLLHFAKESGYRGVAASVIARDPSNLIRTVTIDRGSRDGLREGLPVVDGHAVVGQTTAVTANSSRVLLLTDSSSAIDAIVQRSRASGVAEGLSESALLLRYVLKEYEVQPGDRVIAAGLSGTFPKGVLIGVVTEVDTMTAGMFQRVEISPQVDFKRLESVYVLLPNEGAENFEIVAATESEETP